MGVQFSYVMFFFGGGGVKVLIRHTFLKNPTVLRIFREASHLAIERKDIFRLPRVFYTAVIENGGREGSRRRK